MSTRTIIRDVTAAQDDLEFALCFVEKLIEQAFAEKEAHKTEEVPEWLRG